METDHSGYRSVTASARAEEKTHPRAVAINVKVDGRDIRRERKMGSWGQSSRSSLGRSNQAEQEGVIILRNAKIIHYSWRIAHEGERVL